MRRRHLITSGLMAFFFAFAPLPALAAGLTCNAGQPTGLYINQPCAPMGLTNIFSGFVCTVQTTLDEILSYIYCGVQNAMIGPLSVAIGIFVAVYGLQLMMGLARATVGEVSSRLIKIALVYMFATQSAYGLGIAYGFFSAAMEEGVGWMLSAVVPGIVVPGVGASYSGFAVMDALIYNILTGPFSEGGMKLTGFIAVLSYIIPPVFFLFTYFTVKSAMILVRAVFTFLLALSALAFLMAMAPIFLSFALFRVTSRFFLDWINFLISFALQVVLVFAAVGMWFLMVGSLGQFFIYLINIIVPVTEVVAFGPMRGPVNSWGICPYVITNGVPTCTGGIPWLPSQLVREGSFIYFLTINLVAISLVAYCFDTLMKMIPMLARQLAGPAYVPVLGGDNFTFPLLNDMAGDRNTRHMREQLRNSGITHRLKK